MKIYPVIMSGGAGTRLWPLSLQTKPKQYLSLLGETSLLGATLGRCAQVPHEMDVANPIIIAGANHASLVEADLQDAGVIPEAILLEPFPRNTAVVASVAAAYVKERDADGLVLMLPADHHVSDVDGFWGAVQAGVELARVGRIVTFGIAPQAPETGFGYIKSGASLSQRVYSVDTFTEKPELAVAQEYLRSGDYFWNAGIFLFSAATMIAQMQQYAPRIHLAGIGGLAEAERDGTTCLLAAAPLRACPSVSIDYALMEKTDLAAVVAPVDIGWDDVGSWAALSQLRSVDAEKTDTIELDATDNCLISNGRMIAAVGVEGLVIVETPQAVLVVPKDRAQDVSRLVKKLKSAGRTDLL